MDGSKDDAVLNWLIFVTRASIREDTPIEPNILKRPTFYTRFFYRWVKEGMEDSDLVTETRSGIVSSLSGGG